MAILRNLLGGKCIVCGSAISLEFHPIDPELKGFNITPEFDRPWAELLTEAKKCELRCEECHKKAHAAKHGLGMYSHQKCRCDICRDAWNSKTKEYKKKRMVKVGGSIPSSGTNLK